MIADDDFRPLAPKAAPPLAAEHGDATIYITGLSRCASPGARLGAVVAPAGLASGIAAMLRVDCWTTPALTALIVTRLIEERRLDTIIAD
jgi:DNA-binding transcriptional MocR family regulator